MQCLEWESSDSVVCCGLWFWEVGAQGAGLPLPISQGVYPSCSYAMPVAISSFFFIPPCLGLSPASKRWDLLPPASASQNPVPRLCLLGVPRRPHAAEIGSRLLEGANPEGVSLWPTLPPLLEEVPWRPSPGCCPTWTEPQPHLLLSFETKAPPLKLHPGLPPCGRRGPERRGTAECQRL